MRSGGFLAGDMVDESARDAEAAVFGRGAARAGAGRVYGGEIVGVGGVAEVQGAGGGYCVSESLGMVRFAWADLKEGNGKVGEGRG